MNIILLSGGSGKRLWPLSNDVRSKQFIPIFKNPDGVRESMVQRMYRGVLSAAPAARLLLATGISQVSAIRSQLGENVDLSVEPCRRDTFPAIVLAASYLKDVRKAEEDEPVVVCPIDPFVGEDYFTAVATLGRLAEEGAANLTLMGIEPTYPSEKYGYILPESRDPVSPVSAFREKPDSGTAARYIRAGALWNSGVFAFRLGYVLRKAHERIDFEDYEDLFSQYGSLDAVSFDIAVAEREPMIQVLRFSGPWRDVGTWNTLAEAMDEEAVGKAILEDCSGTHAINELDVPMVLVGLQNVVAAASTEGILVSDIGKSAAIKPIVEKIHQQIMFADKSWGYFKVLSVDENSLTAEITLNPGCRMSYHSHKRRDEIWNIVSGTGTAVVDGKRQNVKPGDTVAIAAGCRHTILAGREGMKLIEVQIGREISVHDKTKHELEE